MFPLFVSLQMSRPASPSEVQSPQQRDNKVLSMVLMCLVSLSRIGPLGLSQRSLPLACTMSSMQQYSGVCTLGYDSAYAASCVACFLLPEQLFFCFSSVDQAGQGSTHSYNDAGTGDLPLMTDKTLIEHVYCHAGCEPFNRNVGKASSFPAKTGCICT